MTEAGKKLLARFRQAEADRAALNAANRTDIEFRGLRIGHGADMASARKLKRDGFVKISMAARGAFMGITEAGRRAIAEL